MASNVEAVKNKVASTKVLTVFDFMEQKKDLIAKALPNTITPDRLIGVFTMLLKSSPQLMECSQISLIGAVIQTIQLGLTPGPIGHAYYVPFNNKQANGSFQKEVQFIIGYRGMIELVNRSGKAVILTAEVVKEKDQFQYEQGLNPILRHIPAEGDRGALIAVYCIAKNMEANEKVFIVLHKEEIEKVKSASKAGASNFSPWAKWPDEMAKKTAVKRICKLLPLALDIQQKISADETIKQTIDKDMTLTPDKTNWDEAEVVETGVPTAQAPQKQHVPDPEPPEMPQDEYPEAQDEAEWPEPPQDMPPQEEAPKKASEPKVAKCEDCGVGITAKVFKFSTERKGRGYCFDCQKKH